MVMSQTRIASQGGGGLCLRINRDVSRAVLVLAVLLAALWSPEICLAQKPVRLVKIEVVGNKHVTQEQVIVTSQLQIGQPIDTSMADAAAEKLMQSGLFKTLSYRLRTTEDQATVIFEVVEAAKNLPVVFENFVWFADEEIARAIRQDGHFFDGTAPQGCTTTNKIDRKSTRLNSSHANISYAVFC